MARRIDLVKREIIVNGIKVNFGRAKGGVFPSQDLIEEIKICFLTEVPWQGLHVIAFKTDVGYDSKGRPVNRYCFQMKCKKALIFST